MIMQVIDRSEDKERKNDMRKRVFMLAAFTLMLAMLTSCGNDAQSSEPKDTSTAGTAVSSGAASSDYSGISVDSPEWVSKLDAAKNADQVFVVAAFSEDATDAWVSLHEKQGDGSWKMVMTTPGFIGKNGLGKTKEGDAKTPVGTFHFNRAFGIADDPGSKMPYTKADDGTYWSGDGREGFHYNELVNIKDYPELDTNECEHIKDYIYHYQYCLNISYNEKGTPGLGSAIFLHCFGPAKPFSGGCVAIPEDHMKYVMRTVDEKTAVVIDSYKNLAGTDEWPDSTWPQVR